MKLSLLRFLRSLSVLLAQQGGNVTPTPLANNPTLVATAGAQGSQGTFAGVLYVHVTSATDTHWLSLGLLETMMLALAGLVADQANILTAADDALRSYWIEYAAVDFQAHPVTGSRAVIDVPALPAGAQIMSARLVVDPGFTCSDAGWNGSLSLGDVGLPARLCSLRADGADGASGDMASGNPRAQDPAAVRLTLNLVAGGTLANLTGGTVMVQICYTVH